MFVFIQIQRIGLLLLDYNKTASLKLVMTSITRPEMFPGWFN